MGSLKGLVMIMSSSSKIFPVVQDCLGTKHQTSLLMAVVGYLENKDTELIAKLKLREI